MNRDNLLGKIRALLAKTQANGCSEFEAMAALDKARAMMDAYEVTEADLALSKEEKAILQTDPDGTRDPHDARRYLCVAVSQFCDCKVWKAGVGKLTFCGLPSDVELATWLLDHLATFVLGELANHLASDMTPRGGRRRIINGFVIGAAARINSRLRALVAQSKAVAASNSRALVVVKSQAVSDKMKAAGIKLGAGRRSSRRTDGAAHQAGMAAGERATFGRPIGGASSRLIGN